MLVLSVVGARPQFVKLAPISTAMSGRIDHVVVHTGQHYDELMSDVFFRDLGIPDPDANLAIGSGKHGQQTGAMLAGLEPLIEQYQPDWVLVYGDTNSTLAAAIAAVKLHVPVAHLEAGLRSFNRRMPEEHNRVLTDHAADLLLAPTKVAMDHLATEGLAERSVLVGDVMTDVLYRVRGRVLADPPPLPAGVERGRFHVATLHRPDNTDDPKRLSEILEQLAALEMPVLLAAHPRLVHLAAEYGIPLESGSIRPIPPLAYPDLVSAVLQSAGVVTDSGGLQKEAFLLRVPCTTIRPETEWVETVELGWNRLVSEDLSVLRETAERSTPAPTDAAPYGDGHAAEQVVDALLAHAP
ncbi:UDP-N-acetylglucosamine 2-epimerase (non-hydrolyzing) [Cryobacterium mesophilum]|uniref:UDP-N-acetylglucosamine 2-epimerase (Non-hydrolyzing) n=1 Tax=Terrimesophilobacter mesophilus TaxID=433647 RepID=A0A4R8V9Q0_9MICO|nr:UDP-N-acetylglucosamine 2-epimerase (non-hydrolyzing) [Terrimesophilobacter mesophilus]MBB5632663.1 UDP-N-acetylglucosamine 2-epimerase (non-hydrolyzing) [Terrimesophilobacter mesophilus]TFB79473.1 UDP-N-acetylglucosamine 2-epimerase (non-hydrolyzing) [Terrimesophilobacter mesophilus]